MTETQRAGGPIVVLQGGRSAEREISLSTGSQVASALGERGFVVVPIDTGGRDFIDRIREAAPSAAFICLHGRYGEDGTIQGLLELLDVPYVGSGVLASALAMDKLMSKRVFAASGIPSPPYVHLRLGQEWNVSDVVEEVGAKSVVKPACEGSSVGMTIVHDESELPPAVEKAFASDPDVIVEAFVKGAEVTVGVLGNDDPVALPTLEIVPAHEYYDYESKYVPGMSTHIIPARVSEEAQAECRRVAVAAHVALGCTGVSRADTIVEPDGRVWLLEVNTIPGMTPTSLLPDAAAASGIAFPELCEMLVGLGLEAWEKRRGGGC